MKTSRLAVALALLAEAGPLAFAQQDIKLGIVLETWYPATDPYTTDPATGAPTGNDDTPKYLEAILGCNHLFTPAKASEGKVRVDVIHRGRNFLAPRPGQSGAQGAGSLVMSIQIGF